MLFNENECWVKNNNSLFDVTMGSFDGAEICELVGLFILSKLSDIIPHNNFGLYRDDGLAIIKNASGPKMDQIRKKITKVFQSLGLNITTDTNLFQTDFLDVTLNLNTGKFSPYRKPNDSPKYININSNHPPSIKNQIPKMINNRISKLSYDQSSFNQASPAYKEALASSGFSTQMIYESNNKRTNSKQHKRKRNIIWFNPPYNEEVKTNIGKTFFNLISQHFPPHSKLHKICNKFNTKLSYSCMPNMAKIIKNHNTRILNSKTDSSEELPCNCRKPNECPLQGKCRTKSIIYKATVTTTCDPPQHYIGCCETEFKTRYNNHRSSFNNKKKVNATELSKLIWNIKDKKIQYNITWSIICNSRSYKSGSKKCNLCLSEKLSILQAEQNSLLNKRSELVSKCRHKNKYKLKSF